MGDTLRARASIEMPGFVVVDVLVPTKGVGMSSAEARELAADLLKAATLADVAARRAVPATTPQGTVNCPHLSGSICDACRAGAPPA